MDSVSWNLFSAMTDPDHQNRGRSDLNCAVNQCLRGFVEGLMTMLIQEVYGLTQQGESLVLEATSMNSRNRYEHLNFKLIETVRMGVGSVGEDGLVCRDKSKAVGFPVYLMVNVSAENLARPRW